MTNLDTLKSNWPWKIFILISFSFFIYYISNFHTKKPNFTEINIQGNIVYAQVADSDAERALGLSYTQELKEDAGMLFIFEKTSVKNFWMRDMNYNIDIVWLDENKQVIGFFENVRKDSYNKDFPEYSKIFRSPANTKYALEMISGSIVRLNITTGSQIDFKY